MFRFRTLTRRFGALYAVVATILVGVAAVVTIHLQGISVDAERLIEEAREQGVTVRLITELDSLQALLARPDAIDDGKLQIAQEFLDTTRSELSMLEGDQADPSRPEHQRSEDRIFEHLSADLERLNGILTAFDLAEAPAALELVQSSRHYAQVLRSEAREESIEANQDLQGRAKSTRIILGATWVMAILLLGLALGLIQRGVVRPLRTLRAGADRFGRGESGHRIHVANVDEIGDLAVSFNTMADRLSRAREDLEERVRQRTREFLRAARMADLGLLASGIAHEINTPLASIASSAEGLERRLQNGNLPPQLLREYSQVISSEAFRAREITRRMLGLVRQEASEISRVSLSLVVEQAESALRHRAAQRDIRIVSKPVSEDLYANVNAGELVQILVNLLANAVDASTQGSSVELRLEVEDDCLGFEVCDQGSGISEQNLERVFEPFFTTKGPGSGTGLGLALVGTMVEGRGGHISVDSEVGRGSTFRVTLPMDWSKSA